MSNSTFTNCLAAPESVPSDAGVAGTGILLAFIITAGLALLLSSFIVLSELRSKPSPHTMSRKILSGLSDQQIVEGIAIQVVGLAQVRSIVPYHFFIIWMLSLLSTATNFATLLALVEDFKRDWVLRWGRQAAMFVNLALSVIYGIFVLETNTEKLSPTLPVICVWQDHAQSNEGQGNQTLSIIGTIAVIAGNGIIFIFGTWYLHMRQRRWGKFIRGVSLLFLMAVGIGATVRVLMISQRFGTPTVTLADRGEMEWSFGQLLTMLLLILPFVSALEIFRGQMNTPHEHVSSESDQIPLTGTQSQEQKDRYSYQNNPFFR